MKPSLILLSICLTATLFPQVASAQQSALELRVDAQTFHRELTYRDDFYGFMREHQLKRGGGLGLRARFYPGALVSSGPLAMFGLEAGLERSFGLESSRGTQRFPHVAEVLQASLRVRLALRGRGLEGSEISTFLGYHQHRFTMELDGPSIPGVLNLPDVPSIRYRAFRYGLEARLVLQRVLRLTLSAAWLSPFSLGGIEDPLWFPRAKARGAELMFSIGFTLPGGFSVDGGFVYRRYFYDLRPEVGDPFIVGGALDEHASMRVGLTYAFSVVR